MVDEKMSTDLVSNCRRTLAAGADAEEAKLVLVGKNSHNSAC